MKIIKGNLITMAYEGKFNVIVQGCNCFCTQGAGLALQMAKNFGTNRYHMESESGKGDINKLGQINWLYQMKRKDVDFWMTTNSEEQSDNFIKFAVINAYTQYKYGSKKHVDYPFLDYEALTLCLRKINLIFQEQHIGLPWIGCGYAGGDKKRVLEIIKNELTDCKVTIVEYDE